MACTKIADMVNGRQMTARTRSHTALHRDAALARIGRARRWLIAGAAGLTGALAAFVSATAHGHTLPKGGVVPAPTRSTGSSPTSSVQMPPLASPSSLGLQGPVQDPQSSSSGSSQSQSGSSSSNQSQSPSPQSQAPAAPAPAPSSSAVVSGGS